MKLKIEGSINKGNKKIVDIIHKRLIELRLELGKHNAELEILVTDNKKL